jgi:hypothetical protein
MLPKVSLDGNCVENLKIDHGQFNSVFNFLNHHGSTMIHQLSKIIFQAQRLSFLIPQVASQVQSHLKSWSHHDRTVWFLDLRTRPNGYFNKKKLILHLDVTGYDLFSLFIKSTAEKLPVVWSKTLQYLPWIRIYNPLLGRDFTPLNVFSIEFFHLIFTQIAWRHNILCRGFEFKRKISTGPPHANTACVNRSIYWAFCVLLRFFLRHIYT